jgi:hypothetical protein
VTTDLLEMECVCAGMAPNVLQPTSCLNVRDHALCRRNVILIPGGPSGVGLRRLRTRAISDSG